MGVQTTYKFSTPVGNPGGLFDLVDYVSNSRNNAENDGVLKFGFGVMANHSNLGKSVLLPTVSDTIFEGVVMNTGTFEMDKAGVVTIPNKATVGVCARGRIWVRIATNAVAVYGKDVYLITAGTEKGKFTTVDDTDSTKVKINGKFITGEYEDVAAIDFFGGAAYAESAATATTADALAN